MLASSGPKISGATTTKPPSPTTPFLNNLVALTRLNRTHGRGGNGINVRLDGPRNSRITWLVHDPVDGKGWSSGQRDTIQRLLPHIRHTVNVQQTLSGAGALGTALTGLLDSTGLGTIQLDARGRIL